MGQSYDCYTDGGDENRLRALYWENPNSTQHGGETFEHPDKIPEILKQYDRQYSPFLGGGAADDYEVPSYLLPSRLLYMGMGVGRGLGAAQEEHPSAWFASVKGRKRWLMHPPNQNSPSEAYLERKGTKTLPVCGVGHFYTSTRVCTQEEGDIMWIPSGWWHETCALDHFTMGIGGLTINPPRYERKHRGKCNLGEDEERNRFLREWTGGQHEVGEIPYCKSGNQPCHVVPPLPVEGEADVDMLRKTGEASPHGERLPDVSSITATVATSMLSMVS